jgi:Rrf2 family protein
MRISAKAEYACLAVIELAKPGDGAPRRVREIAEAQSIPERYLVQILLQLKAAGLVVSERGSVGGYSLARRADDISIAEIIAVIDGPGDHPRRAGTSAARELGDLFDRVRAAEQDVLATTTLAHLADRAEPHDWVL